MTKFFLPLPMALGTFRQFFKFGKGKSALLGMVLALLLFTAGCATTEEMKANRDPWEKMNRRFHNFNHAVDSTLLKPVAQTYAKTLPKPVQQGVSNFFGNLAEPNTILNQFLQGKSKLGLQDSLRFLMNSTLGVGGILNPASHNGLKKHKEDFGQTLAVWGFGEGPYLVLPIFGPATLRDLPGRAASTFTNPLYYVNEDNVRFALATVGTVDTRVRLIDSIKSIDESAMDRYIFVREAYRNSRKFDVYDGNPPLDSLFEDEEFFEDDDLPEEGPDEPAPAQGEAPEQ